MTRSSTSNPITPKTSPRAPLRRCETPPPAAPGLCRLAFLRHIAGSSRRPRSDALYSSPPPNLPKAAATRADVAGFKTSARRFDHGVGAVLRGIHELGLADETLVICTTDHGIAFPGAKATLYDRGIGVMLVVRGPGGFDGGKVIDATVSHLDVFPTLCEVAGIESPPWLQGTSLLPLVRGDIDRLHDSIYAADLSRGLRAPASDPHRPLEVHPALRRLPDPGARQLG